MGNKPNTFNHNVFHAAEEHVINPFKQLHFISGATWCKEEMMKDVQELIEALEKYKGKPVGVINPDNPMRDIITYPAKEALLNWEKKYGKN